jgi:galactokinase/mevalonate kinase-like predicted kinase
VCSLAITRYATATAALDERAARRAGAPSLSDDPLTAAALERAEIAGAVASVSADFPAGAGLGGSSACGVALAGALAVLKGVALAPNELAALSRATEVEDPRLWSAAIRITTPRRMAERFSSASPNARASRP